MSEPTGPAEGEALRRLIEHFREQAACFDEEARGHTAAVKHEKQRVRDAYLDCATRLAALAPLSDPVDGPTCAKHGGFDARCETCPFCLEERSLKRLAGRPVDASGEPQVCKRCLGSRLDTYVNPNSPTGFTERPCPACAAAVPSSPAELIRDLDQCPNPHREKGAQLWRIGRRFRIICQFCAGCYSVDGPELARLERTYGVKE